MASGCGLKVAGMELRVAQERELGATGTGLGE